MKVNSSLFISKSVKIVLLIYQHLLIYARILEMFRWVIAVERLETTGLQNLSTSTEESYRKVPSRECTMMKFTNRFVQMISGRKLCLAVWPTLYLEPVGTVLSDLSLLSTAVPCLSSGSYCCERPKPRTRPQRHGAPVNLTSTTHANHMYSRNL